jgi:hypothetical protein
MSPKCPPPPASRPTRFDHSKNTRGLISLWLYKENNKLQDWKNSIYIVPWAQHTYDFVVLTSLTHPKKIIFVVLQIGK